MKVLFVCADNYPKTGACTSLLNKIFLDGGLINNSEIHIATYKYCVEDKDVDYFKGITIHRLFSTRFFPQKELRKASIATRLLIQGTLQKIQRKICTTIYKKKELDFGRIKEYESFLLQLCEKYKYDIVVGVAGCYEVTLSAQNVAHAKSIKFILYQVDPFTDNTMYNSHYKKQRFAIEKNLYLSSDKVFTTELIQAKMLERLGKSKLCNVEIMEFPGVSIHPPKLDSAVEKLNIINCVFTGRVYEGVRNPTYTIELFRKFENKANLLLYGVEEKELKNMFSINSLPDNVKCYGLVSVDEAENAIQNADVLVNIGNIMLNQVPSKLFSYISTGKPILNICANYSCPSKKYLEQYPYALSVEEDSICNDLTVNNVLLFLMENAGKMCDLKKINELYEKCTPIYVANQMRAAFMQVCKEK